MGSKSTFSNSTSKSYALALYELGKENNEVEQTEEGINVLKELLKQSSDFKEMILSPAIPREEKKNVIIKISELYNFCEILRKFLFFLTIKNRLFFLNRIIDSFLTLVSRNKGELKANLLSSKKLSKVELKNIENELSKDFKSPIKIDYKYDPKLIAGIVLQVGSVMVDTSVRNKLKQLEKIMIEA